MKLAIGLVIKGNEQFVDMWIKSAEKISDIFLIVDNGLTDIARKKLINHPNTKQYLIQKNKPRNQSRDYQKILDMGREEKVDWIFNLDSDEIIPKIDVEHLMFTLLNAEIPSVGLPLIEMRNDDKHYVQVFESNNELRDGRLVHKIYKVLSHFEFDKNDIHGCSIPHNCPRKKDYIPVIIQHYGHVSAKLRKEKRQRIGHDKDNDEFTQTWLEEDESKITIKSWEELEKKWSNKLQ